MSRRTFNDSTFNRSPGAIVPWMMRSLSSLNTRCVAETDGLPSESERLLDIVFVDVAVIPSHK